MESCCIYIYVLWIPSRTVVQCYYFVFHPHESAWWAPLNRFYAGLANFAQTCIGPILRVLHVPTFEITYEEHELEALLALEKPKKNKDKRHVQCGHCKEMGHYAR